MNVQDAISKRVERSILQTKTKANLKRKVGYADEDDEVAEIRKAVSNLHMVLVGES
jgi:DNA-binding FrmR family transcriptional regulator